MNDADRELESLLGPLRDGPIALSGVTAAGSQRERLLPGVRAEVERLPARRRRALIVRRVRTAGGALIAIGLAAMSALALQRSAQTGVQRAEQLRIEPGSAAMTWIDAGGMQRVIKGALTLQSPGELVGARDAWSHVSTARGVALDLAPRARLRVVAAPEITDSDHGAVASVSGLRLLQGEVHCRVPKLGKTKQFSIATPDAQVIVHGTVFSVAVSDDRPTTCVRVSEGLVEVRSRGQKAFVAGGMQWGCGDDATATATEKAPETATDAVTAAEDHEPSPNQARATHPTRTPARSIAATAPRRALRTQAQPPVPDGTLDEENRLLASALAAERNGDARQARKLFAQLLLRHPNSPLIPEARLGLARAR